MSSDSDSVDRGATPRHLDAHKKASSKKARIRASKYTWTQRTERLYLDLLIEGLPKRENGIWPAGFFDSCCQRFKEKGFLGISVKQLNSKRTAWSKKWKTWKVLYDHGAWGFNEATGMLTADDETWTNAINDDPHNDYIRFFRRNALSWRKEMEQIYSGMYAIGAFARGPDDDYPPAPRRARKGDDQMVNSFQAVADRYLSQKTVEVIELLHEVEDDGCPPASKRARKGDDRIVGSVQPVADRYLSTKTVEDAIELLDEVADEWSDTEYFVAVRVVSQNSGIWCALKPKRRMAWLHNMMDEYRAVCK
ncbi:hypothetical protein LTR72_009936 [Exophiala xenobiotica]|nr:hypothetical protein LTR72_009936 [Exophiala xenobiotica]KAK5287603.1 hypothetical protein LTR14_008833 [Exophiala xenobiotica]KAK5377700.1 hypothetical protein LTS13_004570 [Exophiala xenobiotica]KAK5400443.1 hypothetical protein LTR79_002544 [Exophiala xenobiotica]KAK5413290.1 hypothetical protein LTR06_004717 [Exophiala xenobiotica]